MRLPMLSGWAFAPADRTLDFSNRPGFSVADLAAVIHHDTNAILYAKGDEDAGYASLIGSVLTLAADTSGMQPSNGLTILYDHRAVGVPMQVPGAPGRVSAVAGYGAGCDLFNAASTARVVQLFDSFAQPQPAAAPIASVVLGGGEGRSVTFPGPLKLSFGLWASATTRGGDPAAVGDVSGTFFVL